MAKEINHILVIRLSAMGDVAMTVPVLQTFVQTYPQVKVSVLTRKFFFPIFQTVSNVHLHAAEVDDLHKGIFGLSRLARELRDTGIDAVADLHNVLRTNVLRSVFYFYGIPVRQIDKGRSEKRALTDPENPFFEQLKTTHQRYADVFAELGFPIDLGKHVFPDQKLLLSDKVKEIVGNSNKKWIGIAAFAQHKAKTYPLKNMIQVLEQLQLQEKLDIFLFGGGEEEINELNRLERNFPNVKNVAGKLSFEEEIALISHLDLMLSMDSGNAHLAANFNIPVVTLWGVTHPFSGFAPFKQPEENAILPNRDKFPKIPTSIYGNKAPEGYEDVMENIAPERVVKKIIDELSLSPLQER